MDNPIDRLAAPARRALASIGVTDLEDLALRSEDEIASLHGMGPNALRQLKTALNDAGLTFAEPES